jgi:predicted aspartyl protease
VADMGRFTTTLGVEHLSQNGRLRELTDVMVDTGSEFTWVPRLVLEDPGIPKVGEKRFRLADGSTVMREYGWAILHLAGDKLTDLVIFAERGDMSLIGVHTFEGLNLRIDVAKKQLVDVGPIYAVAAA